MPTVFGSSKPCAPGKCSGRCFWDSDNGEPWQWGGISGPCGDGDAFGPPTTCGCDYPDYDPPGGPAIAFEDCYELP